ncbi:MAG: hypothetical protein R3A80_00620 [Bdellovibrionota bacterium]
MKTNNQSSTKEIRKNTRAWARSLVSMYSRKAISSAPVLYTDDGMDNLIEDILSVREDAPLSNIERVYLRSSELRLSGELY